MDELFRNIGFTDQEILIYIRLLRKGPCTQQEISDQTNILRQTVYDVMKKMQAKSYVSLIVEGKKKLYSAVPPEIILRNYQEKGELFESILSALQKMKEPKQEMYVETFMGLEGIKHLFNSTLESSTAVFWASNQGSSNLIIQDYYWENYALKRKEGKIPLKLMIDSDKSSWSKIFQTDKKEFRETRVNNILKNSHCSIIVFDDKVAFYTTKKENLFGVLIKSKEIGDLMSKISLDLWDESDKI